MKKLLVGAAVLLVAGAALWQSGIVHDFIVRSEWAKEKIERFAGRTLNSHLNNLGRLGYYEEGTWIPFTLNELTKRTWRPEQAFLHPRVDFQRVTDGLRLGNLAVKHENGTPYDIVFLEVDPAHAQLRVLVNDERVRESAYVKDMVANHDALAGINAGFFDDDGALGLVLRAGRTLRPANASPGYFVVNDGRPSIRVQRNLRLRGFDEGIQCSPVLIREGQVYSYVSEGKNASEVARRSAVAVTYQNKILLLTTDVQLGGLTIQQLTTVLAGLGARHALALDGGASTQLFVSHSDLEKDVRGWDPVPVALGVFPVP